MGGRNTEKEQERGTKAEAEKNQDREKMEGKETRWEGKEAGKEGGTKTRGGGGGGEEEKRNREKERKTERQRAVTTQRWQKRGGEEKQRKTERETESSDNTKVTKERGRREAEKNRERDREQWQHKGDKREGEKRSREKQRDREQWQHKVTKEGEKRSREKQRERQRAVTTQRWQKWTDWRSRVPSAARRWSRVTPVWPHSPRPQSSPPPTPGKTDLAPNTNKASNKRSKQMPSLTPAALATPLIVPVC